MAVSEALKADAPRGPSRTPKPDLDYLLGRIPELERRYQGDRKVLERIRGLRALDWKVNVPKRLEQITQATGLEYRDATIADELLTLPSIYTAEQPQLSLRGEKDTPAVEGLTTRVEHFTTAALFEDIGCRTPGPPTHVRAIDGTFEGAGWTKLVRVTDLWGEYATASIDDYADGQPGVDSTDGKTKQQRYDAATERMKMAAGVPIEWKSVDALTVLPIYEGDKFVAVIEIQRRSLSDTFRRYRLGFSGDGEIVPEATAISDWSTRVDQGAEVDFIQYWDKDWMSYAIRYGGGYAAVDGGGYLGGLGGAGYLIPGYTRLHKYGLGRPPYYVSLGWTKGYEFGRVATWSAAETKRYLVEYLSFLRTVMAHLAIRDAIPPIFEESPPDAVRQMDGETGQPKGPDVYEMGMKYPMPPGTRVTAMTFPENADKLQAEIGQTSQDIAHLSPARKSGDLGSMGGEGYALSIALEASRNRYNQFESSILRHFREVAIDFWKLCAGLGETIYVGRSAAKDGGYIKVSPTDFKTALWPTFSLTVDSTSANIVKQRFGAAMVASGAWSQTQYIEFMGGNPDEVYEGQAADRIRASETFQKSEEADVLALWGRGSWAEMQAKAEGMAAMLQQAHAGQQPQPGAAVVQGGGGVPPDTASLSMSPNGAGAQPGTEIGGQPVGTPSSPSVPQLAAVAGTSSAGMNGG